MTLRRWVAWRWRYIWRAERVPQHVLTTNEVVVRVMGGVRGASSEKAFCRMEAKSSALSSVISGRKE
jgi:hypothetical protein